MTRLQRLLTTGLATTADLWPSIRQAYAWVHRAARLLSTANGRDVLLVRREYRHLLSEMRHEQAALGDLAWGVAHVRKVTSSYWPGLFQGYTTPGLPRTNHDLEHCFGSARYHERRATGRKGASPAMVVRGPVRVLALVATRAAPITTEALRPGDIAQWRTLRHALNERQETRRVHLRFRRNPTVYLEHLEERLLKLSLPA